MTGKTDNNKASNEKEDKVKKDNVDPKGESPMDLYRQAKQQQMQQPQQ